MKISTKFSSSSIVVAVMMSVVLVGGQYWIRQAQEDGFEKRQSLKDGLEDIHQIRANLRGQMNRLKDSVLGNYRDPQIEDRQKQSFNTLARLEKKFGKNAEIDHIKIQLQELGALSQALLAKSERKSIQKPIDFRSDFQTITAFEQDISTHLDQILGSLNQRDLLTQQEISRLKRIDQVVTYAALGLIILVLGAQYWLILMPVIHAIEKLQFGVSELARGNLDYRLNFNTGDETEQLANEFDHMADRLQESYAAILDRNKEITIANRKLETEITDRKLIEEDLRSSEALLKQQATELEIALRELQQAQLQLVHSEKMSSLGQLVAGIAHEINNPINFIYGNIKYVEEYSKDLLEIVEICRQISPNSITEFENRQDIELEFIEQDLAKVLASMQIGTERIRQIVLSLRNFSRMDEAEFKEVDIHEGLDSTLLILQHRLQKHDRSPTQIIRDYHELPLVECCAGQLNQVFMNILANAIDAIEAQHFTSTGQIKIRTSSLNSDWVEIAISDNGCGIPEDVRSRIFDPFFTTKPVGQGTGMGMSISYQIITQNHRGKLECFSTLGQGTDFVIQIPIRQTVPIQIEPMEI